MSKLNENLKGRAYWRTLEEFSGSPEFEKWAAEEFNGYDPEGMVSLSRRGFMKLAGASMALAGLTLTGCRRWPVETLAPFAYRPEGRVPGEPEVFATISDVGGVATGLLVGSFDGRPVKIEGNPRHPDSLGASNVYHQASVLNLYDPARSRGVLLRQAGSVTRGEWSRFAGVARQRLQAGGFAILSEASSSPTLDRLRSQLPQNAQWYEYESLDRSAMVQGAQQVFGQAVRADYRVADARVVACFDFDLVAGHPASLRYARQWAAGRRSADDAGEMNRLYVAEPAMTCSGAVADERLPIRASEIAALLTYIARELGVAVPGPETDIRDGLARRFAESLLQDLRQHRGQSIIAVGPRQPAALHALAWLINSQLGNLGSTIEVLPEPPARGGTISQLVEAIRAGQVQTLLILGGNPVYDAPADLDFATALGQVEVSFHLSDYVDETSSRCTWHLPRAHFLEAWGDGRAWDGTYSIQQPLILPLFGGRSPIEVLALALGEQETSGYDLVRTTFREGFAGSSTTGADAEARWRRALQDGVLAGTQYQAVEGAQPSGQVEVPVVQPPRDTFEVNFFADALHDGRFANNGWLLELPGQLTKLTWDNAAWINIADAQSLGIRQGDVLRITVDGASIEAPAYLMPGQAQGSLSLAIGYGREAGLTVGAGVGVNVTPLRRTGTRGIAIGAAVEPVGRNHPLALTHHHHLIDEVGAWGREKRVGYKGGSGYVVKDATLATYQRDPNFVRRGEHGDFALQMFNPPEMAVVEDEQGREQVFREPHAWGMAVDMSTCIGCSACVVACQAENNVPVVGKEMVLIGREMHWLRIDRYFKTDKTEDGASADPHAERPQVVFQPMMCVHCENAPCESVCPVAATVHDSEGLNTMVYNRCIGTRYCSNNCPYKVRRFNYYDYHAKPLNSRYAKPWLSMPDTQQRQDVDAIRQMVFNPDVTVRMRGVMEKCTYCTQRIKRATIRAKAQHQQQLRDDYHVHDAEVVTACQQACPTDAIVFGNLNDPNSRVSQLQGVGRAYGVLADLNTRPRTLHLAKIRNPAAVSEALEAPEAPAAAADHH